MNSMQVLAIDGSEVFVLGIRSILLDNKIISSNHFNLITSSQDIRIPEDTGLIIVGQALSDNVQFEKAVEIIKSLRHKSRVLLIPELINSKSAKLLFSKKLVDGIISRTCSSEELVEAINTVMKGEIYIGKEIHLHRNNEQTVLVTKKDNPLYLIQKLTSQEKKIMDYVLEGKSSTDIGQIMFRSVHTIKTHRKNMLHKLGVTNTIELITFLDSVNYGK